MKAFNILALIVVLFMLSQNSVLAQSSEPKLTFNAANQILIDNDRFYYEPDYYAKEIQAFLDTQSGLLKDYKFRMSQSVSSAADYIAGVSLVTGISPKILLVMLEQQNSLITNPKPDSKSLTNPLNISDPNSDSFSRQVVDAAKRLYDLASRFDRKGQNIITFQDGTKEMAAPSLNATTYAIQAFLAERTTRDKWLSQIGDDSKSFTGLYKKFFGQNPTEVSRTPRRNEANQPFFDKPYVAAQISSWPDHNLNIKKLNSFFDHETPNYSRDYYTVIFNGERTSNPSNVYYNCADGSKSCYDGHSGIDYKSIYEPIKAVAAGRVVFVGWATDYGQGVGSGAGYIVVLDHQNGYLTHYWHLSNTAGGTPTVGSQVNRGDIIGQSGATGAGTGPHLHLETKFYGKAVDPYGWCGNYQDPNYRQNGVVSVWLWQDEVSPCNQTGTGGGTVGPTAPGEITVDNYQSTFSMSGPASYIFNYNCTALDCFAGSMKYTTNSISNNRANWGEWRPSLTQAGFYDVYVSIGKNANTAGAAYKIYHKNGSTTVILNQNSYGTNVYEWVKLGNFEFVSGTGGYVYLDDVVPEKGSNQVKIGFDAVSWKLTSALAPVMPDNLVATAISSTQVNLTWADNSSNETGFRLERKIGTSGSWSEISLLSSNVTSYQNIGLSPLTAYYYRVRAYNAVGNSNYSNEASVTTPAAPPNAPLNLAANLGTGTQVRLTWIDNANNETGLQIERKAGNGAWVEIIILEANRNSYDDNSASSLTTYSYRLRAYNAVGFSAYSNIATATTPDVVPNAPTNLVATVVTNTQVRLTWADNSNNETGFQLERKIGLTGTWAMLGGIVTTVYTDTSLQAGTAYYYRVRAFNVVGNSAYSNEATVTTPQTAVLAPSNLQVRAVRLSNDIMLSWQDNSNNELGFRLECKIEGLQDWTEVAVLGAGVTSVVRYDLDQKDYQYRIRAYNTETISNYSNVVRYQPTQKQILVIN